MKHIIKFTIIFCLLLLFAFCNTQAQQKTDSLKATEGISKIVQDSTSKRGKTAEPMVTKIYSMECYRTANMAVYGDFITMEVANLDVLLAQLEKENEKKDTSVHNLVLFINGSPVKDIVVHNINTSEGKLTFQLDKYSASLMKYYPNFKYLWSSIVVKLSAGIDNQMPMVVQKDLKIKLYYISTLTAGLTLLFIAIIFAAFLILAKRTNLIRIGDKGSAFSLALSQLAFWTVVIAMSYVYIWVSTGDVPALTGSTLILLSISITTTAGARLVDKRRNDDPALIPKSSGSFFEDILSDDLGYSVHRCQMFLWTVILGIIFIKSVVSQQMIPQIDESLLGLMGISSGAYIGLKMTETSKTKDKTTTNETN